MNVQFSYDESTLYERVVRLPGPERTLFAAACAERLMPLYEWVASVEPCVRPALDLVWSPSATSEQVEQAQMEVEKLVPDEDDEHAPVEVALVQNALAAVAYALRSACSQDAKDAVWAARQLLEAADYIVQREAPSQSYIENVEQEAAIQLALRGIRTVLQDLENSSSTQLRARAEADGDALLVLFKSE